MWELREVRERDRLAREAAARAPRAPPPPAPAPAPVALDPDLVPWERVRSEVALTLSVAIAWVALLLL